MKHVHPFPARMAPEWVLKKVRQYPKNFLILDPMAGSGTVLSAAAGVGINAIGFDLDPMAILMSRVATTVVCMEKFAELSVYTQKVARQLDCSETVLPWIDECTETSRYIDYWFAPKQKSELRKIAHVLHHDSAVTAEPEIKRALSMVMSKMIITKEPQASLARDTSRSRPHKVKIDNDYDVLQNFGMVAKKLGKVLEQQKILSDIKVKKKDARSLDTLGNNSVDVIITSPPYLNAIDYMRGHRLSLVWLEYSIPSLRKIRSDNIGAENGVLRSNDLDSDIESIFARQKDLCFLPPAMQKMVKRYICDALLLMAESYRVLKPGGRAVYVVADSSLRGVKVRNSEIIAGAAKLARFCNLANVKRNIPINKRSLPFINRNNENSLNRRMRYERVLTFEKR